MYIFALIFLLFILLNGGFISVKSGFWGPIHFIPEISHPTITYLCRLSDLPHGKKPILNFRAIETKKTPKPNRENRRVLFPLLSDFLKRWRQCTSWGIWTTSSSNSGCGLWHRAFWNPGYLYSRVSVLLQKELRFPVNSSCYQPIWSIPFTL